MTEFSYLTAFTVGLFGGVHCIGMCGGIAGALTFGLSPALRGHSAAMLSNQLSYNLGRIASYSVAGAVMGSLGMLLAGLLPVYYAQRVLLAVAGIFMLLLGLYLSGWWMLLTRLEAVGRKLWQHIEPLGRRMLPVRSPWQALLFGMVWGWIPCGLVYSMLVSAIATGSALQGAMLMLSFGLGTLPTLMTVGLLSGAAARLTRSSLLRRAAGVAVMLFGVITLWRAM